MSVTTNMSTEDIGEMRMAATAATGLFPRIEIDPAHLIELCDLAAEALKVRAAAEPRANDYCSLCGGDGIAMFGGRAITCSCVR